MTRSARGLSATAELLVPYTKWYRNIPTGTSITEASNAGWARFSTNNLALSR